MTNFAPETVFYAIGDVHGLASRLAKMHAQILDHHRTYHAKKPIAIIHLGDYVDRGEQSRGVIDTIRDLEAKAHRLESLTVMSLRGNHEQMMLEALAGNASSLDLWLNNGGRATLRSYKRKGQDIDEVLYNFPKAHRSWLEALPNYIHDEGRKLIFVHAGIDPARFPELDPQICLWTRSPRFFDPTRWREYPALEGYRVVHGHTPTMGGHPEIAGADTRINVDTGAVFGGPLTAVILADNHPLGFLKVN